jgi:hypothetical protein
MSNTLLLIKFLLVKKNSERDTKIKIQMTEEKK